MAVTLGMKHDPSVALAAGLPGNTETIMKNIITLAILSALGHLASCTFVDTPKPTMYTTRTSEPAPTVYGSTETTTTRTY